MLYDVFENVEFYCTKEDKLYKAIKYAFEFDLSQPDGEYVVQGRDIFAKVQSYTTQKPEDRTFEAHRDYFDVQVMRVGSERQDVYIGNETDLEPLTEYNSEKDAIKLKAPASFSSLIVAPGQFAVYYPQDIHRPNCCVDKPSEVRKICMKVRL